MVRKTILGNGIRVITERIPAAHSVTVGFWVLTGSRHEPGERNGISHFVEHMLFKGTPRRNALDIAKEIDSVGGILNGFTSREYSCYYSKVLAKKLPLAIDLLSDILLNSIFDPDEIEKERKVILQEIYMQEDTPDEHIHDLYSQTFWKEHPLGWPILGDRETVGRLTRDSLLSFMGERYCGSNLIVCAAGDLDHQAMVEEVASKFDHLPARGSSPQVKPSLCSRGINILEKDLEQVHICLGTQALPQNHPTRFALYLLNAILGGSMSSRLFQKIREEQGLAYSIYSYLNCHSDAGTLVVYSGTSPADGYQVIDIVLGEFKRLISESVEEDELRFAKEQMKGNLLLSMESTDNRMTRIAKNEIYLARQVSLKGVLNGINQVTQDEILSLSQELFRDEYLNLQLIGRNGNGSFSQDRLTIG